jgi:hypothetical protein
MRVMAMMMVQSQHENSGYAMNALGSMHKIRFARFNSMMTARDDAC